MISPFALLPIGYRTDTRALLIAGAIGILSIGSPVPFRLADGQEKQESGSATAGQPGDAARSGERRTGARRGGPFGDPSAFDILDRAEVRADVKLSDEQVGKIEELMRGFDKQRQELGQIFRGRTTPEELQKAGDEFREKNDALRKSAEEAVQGILTEEQFRRYSQIALQITGINALRRPDVADAIKLTESQRAEVARLRTDADGKMRSLGFFGGWEARQKILSERDTALAALLTPEQKHAWEGAQGTPLADSKPAEKVVAKPAVEATPAATRVETPTAKSEGEVVANFSASASAGKTADSEERKLSFSFRFAPWEMVLRRFAEEAGLTLDMNDVPPGTLNHYDHQKYTPAEALDVLNGYLLRRGFLLVRRDQFLVVLNIDNGIPPNLIPQVSVAELPKRGRNELLSVVFPLTDADAKTAAEDVKELLGPQGKVVPLTKVNRLLVTDIGTNLQRIHELLTGLGVVEDSKGTGFRSFKLVHVTAVDAERMIRDLFNLPARGSAARAAATSAASAANRPAYSPDREWGRGGRDWRNGGGGGRGGDGGGRWGENNGAPSGSAAAPTASTSKIQLTVDARTNSLLVTASGEDLHLVEQAIRTIDVPEGRGAAGAFNRRSQQPQVEVYPVENADIQVVVDMIDATVPGLTLRPDPKTRRINVFATPEDQEQLRNIIRQLDGGAGESVTVIQLHKLEAVAATSSLRNLFSTNKTDPPSIEADSLGRRLMVRGTPEQVAQIRKLLADLGEEGDNGPSGGRSGGGPIRTIVPGGRSADELVELVQRLMPQPEGSFLRVVPPSAIATPSFRLRDADDSGNTRPKGIRREPLPAGAEREGASSPRFPWGNERGGPPSNNSGISAAPRSLRSIPAQGTPIRSETLEPVESAENARLSRELEAALDDLDGGATDDQEDSASGDGLDAETDDEAEGATQAGVDNSAMPRGDSAESEEVRITSYDGKILIASENLKALDQLEELLQSLAQVVGQKTKWTVYYLRSADATETATILGSLFPTGSVTQPASSGSGLFSGFRGGLSSLGSSLMDATGLGSLSQSNSLRIVPETRSNALFISGPESQVGQVLEALEVLDAAELPPSLKDRTPRQIAVNHADVDDVAAIVRDVYKEELEAPQSNPLQGGGNRGGGFNPLAMLIGAGASQNTRQRGVQLTIGVDRRTSTLIVSASDPLFRQVESLVQSLDESAAEARRTVRVESIRSGSSELVETALKPLLGKVTVSSTGRRAPNNAPPGAPPGGGAPAGGDEAARAIFRQQMMERMMQGGGSPFGSGFSGFGGGNRGDGGNRSEGGGRGFQRGGGDSGNRGFGGGRSRFGNN